MSRIEHKQQGENHRISFVCPGCKEEHELPVEREKVNGKWTWNWSLDKPTITPSILMRTGHYVPGKNSDDCWCTYNAEHPDDPAPFACTICHSFVRDGKIQFLGDCTHELKNQTVELPIIEETP